jgi:deferrochelatase/peroxidase EfeB
MSKLLLENKSPIDFRDEQYRELLRKLQGNILKGHGRDYTINIFLQFHVQGDELRKVLRWLAKEYVTSAYEQLAERDRYKRFAVPGGLFGNLFLSREGYEGLQLASGTIDEWFREDDAASSGVSQTLFLDGMYESRDEFHDVLPEAEEGKRQPLEVAYQDKTIHAMVLLADDTRPYLLRTASALMNYLECENIATVVAVEHGEVLRNANSDGIEHFGYVDGRSQPLFLKSDFRMPEGAESGARRRERIAGQPDDAENGKAEFWDPFAQLKLALVRDPAVDDPSAFGSFYVFRKLEQDVRRFAIAEQQLADALGLKGADRERAGAMIVGRFRDGTPLTLSQTPGFIPAKANDFRYDGLDANFAQSARAPIDTYGLKCPFQAHIRKVNPRQNVNVSGRKPTVEENAANDREHRIVRRGMPYGTREPRVIQNLEDLPSRGVGLLFACFQASLVTQFGFMQRKWASDIGFIVNGEKEDQTGLDGIIGQRRQGETIVPQHWRPVYGDTPQENAEAQPAPSDIMFTRYRGTHTTDFQVNGFVKFRGGEFLFAPSLTFLLGGASKRRVRKSRR